MQSCTVEDVAPVQHIGSILVARTPRGRDIAAPAERRKPARASTAVGRGFAAAAQSRRARQGERRVAVVRSRAPPRADVAPHAGAEHPRPSAPAPRLHRGGIAPPSSAPRHPRHLRRMHVQDLVFRARHRAPAPRRYPRAYFADQRTRDRRADRDLFLMIRPSMPTIW